MFINETHVKLNFRPGSIFFWENKYQNTKKNRNWFSGYEVEHGTFLIALFIDWKIPGK